MVKVHFTPGDGAGWALDEDLRQIRVSLAGVVSEVQPWNADVIHAPFWQNLAMVAPEILARTFVIAHADNPPFFYLKQPDFAWGQRAVDLWVARSREAFCQFQALGLPVEHVPYTIDGGMFFPMPDKTALRREFGIPADAYVIANFHRDTEGSDLVTPKLQKAPELMIAILERLQNEGVAFHVLLAGPRRHWIRKRLWELGIPFTFVGKPDVEGDDFGVNILGRAELNKLYNAADLYLVPSRWEGGPQSVMEAAASRIKVLSVPLGLSRDILDERSLFRTVREAAVKIRQDMESDLLEGTLDGQMSRWKTSHTTETMGQGLRQIYEGLPSRMEKKRLQPPVTAGMFVQARHALRRRVGGARRPAVVGWNHVRGRSERLDGILKFVQEMLGQRGVRFVDAGCGDVDMVGWPGRMDSGASRSLQWIVPDFPVELIIPGATVITPAVQDILNLRAAGVRESLVVCPVVRPSEQKDAEPFVVPRGERHLSLEVWDALASGRPVVYPRDLAYWEQVFHGGIGFEGEDSSGALQEVRETGRELQGLIRAPQLRDVEKFVLTLLGT